MLKRLMKLIHILKKLEIETGDVFVDIFEIDDEDTHDIIGYKKDGTPIYN